MTSICSFLWKSSHSSLYLSISSLVWRIFFFSTSNREPCCMVVMMTSRQVDKQDDRKTAHLRRRPRVSDKGKRGKTGNGVAGRLNDAFGSERLLRFRWPGKWLRLRERVSRHAFVAVTDGRTDAHKSQTHTQTHTESLTLCTTTVEYWSVDDDDR